MTTAIEKSGGGKSKTCKTQQLTQTVDNVNANSQLLISQVTTTYLLSFTYLLTI